jgi:hypothetical protein
MDGNNKNNFLADPLPPSYLSVALMICPGVQANSVHSCNAGNVNDRLNVSLESRAWLESVPCLAPWNISVEHIQLCHGASTCVPRQPCGTCLFAEIHRQQ